jgi:hypothetical protein
VRHRQAAGKDRLQGTIVLFSASRLHSRFAQSPVDGPYQSGLTTQEVTSS